ncbi:hypothetical protein KY285_007294 [Solanum tuberosum]|nr:hypothetical protein KY285_007294 [Solanum tuberosum]
MKDYFNLSIGEEKIELPFLDSHLLSFTVAHTQTHTVSRVSYVSNLIDFFPIMFWGFLKYAGFFDALTPLNEQSLRTCSVTLPLLFRLNREGEEVKE